jgi:uncharacterized protein (DUF58 family)
MPEGIVLERMLPALRGIMPSGADSFKKQRVYIFPTRQGMIFALMLLVMLLGAINYNNSMAFVLTFLLGSLAVVCILHTYRNLAGLVLRGAPPQPVFTGEYALFPINLDNRIMFQRYSIEFTQAPSRGFRKILPSASITPTIIDIPANQLKTIHIQLKTVHRGFISPGRLKISSCFPLGLFRAWSYLETGQTCVVYPKPAGDLPIPPAVIEQFEFQKGDMIGTDDFIGFRKYRPGDSTRNIAWKALARGQGPLVKRFNGKGASKLMLNWDDVSHLHNTEKCLSQLCQWALSAEMQNIHYGLMIPGVHIDPGHGDHHKHYCLESLAGYGLDEY